jgi:hypothetical protein
LLFDHVGKKTANKWTRSSSRLAKTCRALVLWPRSDKERFFAAVEGEQGGCARMKTATQYQYKCGEMCEVCIVSCATEEEHDKSQA